MPARVLVVYGSESGTCKRLAGAMAKEWAARAEGAFEISRVCDGAALIQDMSVMEDDNNRIHSDFSSLRSKYDVLLLLTSSYGEGDPPENFGAFFLGLLAAAASGSTPLAGMQHSVFGQGSTVYQETFQNMPRLTDRFLGECGSRRFVMRQEVDAAHYIDGEQHVVDGNHWRETVLETLRAMPKASAPAVCGWEEARCSQTVVCIWDVHTRDQLRTIELPSRRHAHFHRNVIVPNSVSSFGACLAMDDYRIALSACCKEGDWQESIVDEHGLPCLATSLLVVQEVGPEWARTPPRVPHPAPARMEPRRAPHPC